MADRVSGDAARSGVDLGSTLDVLDPPTWPAAPPSVSETVMRCHRLRRTPLRDYTLEDIRLMIDHRVALSVLVPMALDVLRLRPLVRSAVYRGDLLHMVMSVPSTYWTAHPEDDAVLRQAMARAQAKDPGFLNRDTGDAAITELVAHLDG